MRLQEVVGIYSRSLELLVFSGLAVLWEIAHHLPLFLGSRCFSPNKRRGLRSQCYTTHGRECSDHQVAQRLCTRL